MNILEYFKNFFFPIQCIICSRSSTWLCQQCQNKLIKSIPECYLCRRISKDFATHPQCIQQGGLFTNVVYCWRYNQLSSQMLKVLKYKLATDISQSISDLLYRRLVELNVTTSLSGEVITLIPLSSLKMNDRGFNQDEVILSGLIGKFNSTMIPDLLIRTSNQKSQATSNYQTRIENSRHLFVANPRHIKAIQEMSGITIFDDVITTGSTLVAAAKALRLHNKTLRIKAICMLRGRAYWKGK